MAAMVMSLAVPLHAQTEPGHDISKVDPAPLGGAMSVPLPEKHRRKLKRYEIPELTGSRQAIGSQLVNGDLPRPLLDYHVRDSAIDQRISFFDGGLVVVRLTGAGGTIHKRVIIPGDALKRYLDVASIDTLRTVRSVDVTPATDSRQARFRIYASSQTHAELIFDPSGAKPKRLHDQLRPLEDLLRAITEDRNVTSTVAGYEPKAGDELVGDDRKVYRVQRVIAESGIVELHCLSQPTILYVAKQDLHNYFVGKRIE